MHGDRTVWLVAICWCDVSRQRGTELTSRRNFPVNGTRVLCQGEGPLHLRHRDLIDRQRSTYLGQLHTHLEDQRVRWELALGRDARVLCVPI